MLIGAATATAAQARGRLVAHEGAAPLLSELEQTLGPISITVRCPTADLGPYSEVVVEQKGRRRTVRIQLSQDTTRYREPEILGGLLNEARFAADRECPLLFRRFTTPDADYHRYLGGGAIDIYAPGSSKAVTHVAGFTKDRFGTITDLRAARDSAQARERAAQAKAARKEEARQARARETAEHAARVQAAREAAVSRAQWDSIGQSVAWIGLRAIFAVFVVTALMLLWRTREALAEFLLSITPERRRSAQVLQYSTASTEKAMSEKPQPARPTAMQRVEEPMSVASHVPPAPLGMEFLNRARIRTKLRTLQTHTEFVEAVTAHFDALTAQITAEARHVKARVEAEGLAAKAEDLARYAAEDHALEIEVRRKRKELELAELNLKIAQATGAVQGGGTDTKAATERGRLAALFDAVREIEASIDEHIAELIRNAGGADALGEDTQRHIDQLQELKAVKVAELYEQQR